MHDDKYLQTIEGQSIVINYNDEHTSYENADSSDGIRQDHYILKLSNHDNHPLKSSLNDNSESIG